MTQLDSSVAPAIRQLEHFSILQPELHRMKNGMPLYVLSAGNEDVIRFDLLVRSGQLDQSQPLQAVFTNRMLREGTVRMTSGEIAERLDYYGAWLDLSSSVNCGFVTLYTLTKHLDRTMEIVAGLVTESVFPEEQFRIICDINCQQLLVNNQRVDVLARKQLNRSLFGTSHPLGRYAELEDYERIQVEALKDFYHRHYHSGNCSMYVSGKVTPEATTGVTILHATTIQCTAVRAESVRRCDRTTLPDHVRAIVLRRSPTGSLHLVRTGDLFQWENRIIARLSIQTTNRRHARLTILTRPQASSPRKGQPDVRAKRKR